MTSSVIFKAISQDFTMCTCSIGKRVQLQQSQSRWWDQTVEMISCTRVFGKQMYRLKLQAMQ